MNFKGMNWGKKLKGRSEDINSTWLEYIYIIHPWFAVSF